MKNFTIKNVIEEKIKEFKIDLFEEDLYKRVCILFNIWQKQKELGYLYDVYAALENKQTVNTGEVYEYDEKISYKTQYISFLMKHDLIWLDDCKDKKTVLTMIYYWLLADIKKDKITLNSL